MALLIWIAVVLDSFGGGRGVGAGVDLGAGTGTTLGGGHGKTFTCTLELVSFFFCIFTVFWLLLLFSFLALLFALLFACPFTPFWFTTALWLFLFLLLV